MSGGTAKDAASTGRKGSQRSGSSRSSTRNHRPGHESSQRGRRKSASSTFPCEICGELYSRLDNLRVHQRMHSGEMPFKCKYCNRPFRWAGALRSHEAGHTRSTSMSGNGGEEKSLSRSSKSSSSSKRASGSSRSKDSSALESQRRSTTKRSGTHHHLFDPREASVTVSETDPSIRDYVQRPWHDVLDD